MNDFIKIVFDFWKEFISYMTMEAPGFFNSNVKIGLSIISIEMLIINILSIATIFIMIAAVFNLFLIPIKMIRKSLR
jgi:hypothetical protein